MKWGLLLLVFMTAYSFKTSRAYMNTECVNETTSLCVTDEIFETEINCCTSLETADSAFQGCKGWCSTKAISSQDESKSINQSYLLRYAPGVSTNLDCMFWWSYLGVGDDNSTRLSTASFNFTKGQICIMKFRPYTNKWRVLNIKVNRAINVEFLGVKHHYEPKNEINRYEMRKNF